jgi:phytoene dehydrogenase-like protein
VSDPDVIVVGGGHNGLVAAAYLARSAMRVVVLEARETLGGAVASARVFPGMDASLSRFSYLVSVLPQQIIDDLGLRLELRSRSVASYTPVGRGGLLVERREGEATQASFREVTGSGDDYVQWQAFHERLAELARVVAPSLTGPLPRESDLRTRVDPALWSAVVERPLGELIEDTFGDDTVRGIVLTDALIGILASAHDASLRQNRCFLYHVIGNGTGEWRVPVGGMGAVSEAMEAAARTASAELRTGAAVAQVLPREEGGAEVVLESGERLAARYVLAGCAPAVLERLLGRAVAAPPEGSQTKVNLLVRRLPRLTSGVDPEVAFAGTMHLGQGYGRLEEAFTQGSAGHLPDPMPCEVYCHSLTDASILSPELRAAGFHTLTLFGLHTPARLFVDDPDGMREAARRSALHALQEVLAEPLEDCLARDAHGDLCVEVMTPLDVETELNMPGGHIFHGDLSWPWLEDEAVAETPAERWGVATDLPGILLCGSGSVRGGAVSGLGGHSAAQAVLEAVGLTGQRL